MSDMQIETIEDQNRRLRRELDQAREVTDEMVRAAVKEWERLDNENAPIRPDQRRDKYVRAMLAQAFSAQ